MPPLLRVLIMADTHNHLPAHMRALAAGVHEIWHLGDVCRPALLEELRLIGPPVTLVRGNCDSETSWPLVVDLTRDGLRFRLQHIPPSPRRPATGCDVLLHGHTHVPRDETRDGVRFLNPGCVTRPNRGAPPSVAFLDWNAGAMPDWKLRRLR